MSKLVLRSSQIVQSKLRFEGKPMSYHNYPLSQQVLDTEADVKLMIGGRQITKSITLMAECLTRIMGRAHYKILYIAPKVDQAKTFSIEKIHDRIQESAEFRKWYVDKNCFQNVFLKTFRNGCKIYFRAATQVNVIRGISSDLVIYDEIQHIDADCISVIDETMSGRESKVSKLYAGTPLTIQNFIQSLWSDSKQITPIMVCNAKIPHHQVPSLENIRYDGLRCNVCNERIDARNSYFLAMQPNKDIVGFWLPQIVFPLHSEREDKWATLWNKFKVYSPERFMNEIMGVSVGQGQYLCTLEDIQNCCKDSRGLSYPMWEYIEDYRTHGIREFWAGIDWAITNSTSYTVLTIGGLDYETNRFRIVYAKKYEGTDHLSINQQIAQTLIDFNVEKVCADWGAGHVNNRLLEVYMGRPHKWVMDVQYTTDREMLHWDDKCGWFKAARSLSLITTFQLIRAQRLHFFQFEQFDPFSKHILAEFMEEGTDNRGNTVVQFNHAAHTPDDYLHALNVMLVVFASTHNWHPLHQQYIRR